MHRDDTMISQERRHGGQRLARRADVIDQDHGARGLQTARREATDAKASSGPTTFAVVEFDLRRRPSATKQATNGRSKLASDALRKHPGVIDSSMPTSPSARRHRNDDRTPHIR